MEGEEERSSSSSIVLSSTQEDEEADVECSLTPSNCSDYTDQQVMSEVHLGCPPFSSGPHISHFTFPCPPRFEPEGSTYDDSIEGVGISACQMIGMDEAGDLVLTQRRTNPSNNCRMSIQHSITSSIPSVGLQVWKAELLLADFLLHSMFTSSDLDDIVALELGAGTGLLGILLACAARTVFLTDHGEEVLKNCATNVDLNSEIFKDHQASIYVRELDWNKSWPPTVSPDYFPSHERYRNAWEPSEVEEVENASLLLAADVIYSDDLTDALFNTLQRLMSRGSKKVLYLALEKRYNFSLSDLDVVANGYSRFQSYLKDEAELGHLDNRTLPCFVGSRIDLTDIPQYVREYDRGTDVEDFLALFTRVAWYITSTCCEDCLSHRSRNSWAPSEVENASLLLAADVIYSDDLTDALFNTLQRLMSRGSKKVLYLALEKRYNFSLSDLDVVANVYSRFQSYLKDEAEIRHLDNRTLPCFVGSRIDLTDIPEYVREYDRGTDVEVWKIKYISDETIS